MKLFSALVLSSFLCLTAVYSKAMDHTKMKKDSSAAENVGICPVTGEPATSQYSYIYKSTTYYFCCSACIDQFKKNPAKYISKIKEIRVEAFKYGFKPDPITVKKNDIVRITLTSRDTTHGFAIKEYGIDVHVKKGEQKKVEFHADKPGTFEIYCSVFCGFGHHKMKAKLIVQDQE